MKLTTLGLVSFFNIVLDIEKNPLEIPACQVDDPSRLPLVLLFLTTIILLCDHLLQYFKCKDLRKSLQKSW
jgi:hypothetical protein